MNTDNVTADLFGYIEPLPNEAFTSGRHYSPEMIFTVFIIMALLGISLIAVALIIKIRSKRHAVDA